MKYDGITVKIDKNGDFDVDYLCGDEVIISYGYLKCDIIRVFNNFILSLGD